MKILLFAFFANIPFGLYMATTSDDKGLVFLGGMMVMQGIYSAVIIIGVRIRDENNTRNKNY